jgi:hypothetical protein
MGNGNLTFGDSTVMSSAGTVTSSANGRMKLPNGIIMQWGQGTTAAVSANVSATSTTTFPLAFTTCYEVIIGGLEVSSASWNLCSPHVQSFTNSQFVANFAQANNATQGSSMAPIYIAFGV